MVAGHIQVALMAVMVAPHLQSRSRQLLFMATAILSSICTNEISKDSTKAADAAALTSSVLLLQ